MASGTVRTRRSKSAASRRYARVTRQRARLLLKFVPGIRSALKHWVPDAVADDFCDGLVAQLHALIRNPHASLR